MSCGHELNYTLSVEYSSQVFGLTYHLSAAREKTQLTYLSGVFYTWIGSGYMRRTGVPHALETLLYRLGEELTYLLHRVHTQNGIWQWGYGIGFRLGEESVKHLVSIGPGRKIRNLQRPSQFCARIPDIRIPDDVILSVVMHTLQRDFRVGEVLRVILAHAYDPGDILVRILHRFALHCKEVAEPSGAEPKHVVDPVFLSLKNLDVDLAGGEGVGMYEVEIRQFPTAHCGYIILVYIDPYEAACGSYIQSLRSWLYIIGTWPGSYKHNHRRICIVWNHECPYSRLIGSPNICQTTLFTVTLEEVCASDELATIVVYEQGFVYAVCWRLLVVIAGTSGAVALLVWRRAVRTVTVRPSIHRHDKSERFSELIQPVYGPDVYLPSIFIYNHVIKLAIVGIVMELLDDILSLNQGNQADCPPDVPVPH